MAEISTPDGIYLRYHKNGKLKERAEIVNGQREGQVLRWHDNEQIRSLSLYVKGRLQGDYQEWDKKGVLRISCQYTKGVLNGMWMQFNRKGKPIREEFYERGEIAKILTFLLQTSKFLFHKKG
jgi:antitoxin component YwqK of YwqJK toxin-antitoxin module